MCIFQALFDYEVDSDDEWEEEDPGESVSSDEVGLPEKYPAPNSFYIGQVRGPEFDPGLVPYFHGD